ncbi:glycosyltransferase [Niabella sp.]|uniref:glycosyltransferase n=1 Tax=Niabella sp. TaxID=1962976 RepID=UPI0026393EB2|nr:glycosyltransferase [Niabella sp.]
MPNSYTVSVCITTYNMEHYIARALDSVVKQETGFSYEIIVADDASTDQTVAIVKTYQALLGNRLKLLESEKNQGVMANYNRALECASGAFIASLDADDYWIDIHKLQKQVNLFYTQPDIGYIHTNFYYEDETTGERVIARDQYYQFPEEDAFTSTLLHYDIFFSSSCFRRTLINFDELKVYAEKKFYAQDLALFLHLTRISNGFYMPDPTTVCCYRTNSRSRLQNAEQRIENYRNTAAIEDYFIAQTPIPASLNARRIFNKRLTILLASWETRNYHFVKQHTEELSLRSVLRHRPGVAYIYIASKNPLLFRLLLPWVLRNRTLSDRVQ